MVSFRVEIDNKSYALSVDRTPDGKFQVRLNDAIFECEAVTDEPTHLLIRGPSRLIRARAKIRQGNRVEVWLSGLPFSATVQTVSPAAEAVAREERPGVITAEEIRAVMPGRVTSILVRQGDEVDVGTPLIMMEAMKMQNEIVSPRPGRIKSIHVEEGSPVKRDSILIVFEPL